MSSGIRAVRAEHPSLDDYLRCVLSPEQRRRVALVSFNQWGFVVGAVGEIALSLHAIGAEPVVALWSDETPMRDIAWTTSKPVARLLRSRARDDRLRAGLLAAGLPERAFPSPPLRRWNPVGDLPAELPRRRSRIRELRYREGGMGRAILQSTPDTETPVSDDYEWPVRWLKATSRSYAWAFDQVRSLIDERGITALIAYNGRFLHDAAAAAAASAAGIPVLSYDLGGHDTAFDLTADDTHDWSALQKRMLALYDSWPIDERDAIAASWFLDRRNHADALNSRFVESQRIGEGIVRPDGLVVTYFSSSGDEISELELDWSEYFGDQATALRALAEACRQIGATLVVRSHPHKRRKPRRDVLDWHEAVHAAAPDVHLDEHSPVDSYTLMSQSDVVVTYGSTTGVEAAFAGRPVVVMGPSAYDELGCATRVRNVHELVAALLRPRAGVLRGALAYGLLMRRRGFSCERVVSAPDDDHIVGGVRTSQPTRVVRAISDLLVRGERARLARGSAWSPSP